MEGESRYVSAVRRSVSSSFRIKIQVKIMFSDSVRFPQRLSYKMFDVLLRQVKRLLVEYPDWLSIERCQIDFYHKQLSFLSRNFERRLVTYRVYSEIEEEALRLLASEILTSEHERGVDPPDLTCIGEQLASQVARIHKAFFHEFKDFHCYFYFHKKKFEECDGEALVGFQEEVTNLLHQLASITKKQLQVISIVGMAGLGKTTLATRLYNDPYVVSYFYVRAWVTCSQVYRKRDLLLSILSSVTEITPQVSARNDNMLAHDLYRALKGRRYLIVIDDIWSIKAWDDFKSCFPDGNNGSRVMLTTRLKDIALHAQTEGNPLCLRFLTEEESFDLFKRKAFIHGNISRDLSSIGLNIMKKCRGLPLAIVVIAGVLKYDMEIDWWTHVEETVSSYIVTDVNQYMDTLALSYNHLPQHLRSCFLSFGAFREDHDIPVYKLSWLWIAKGFILEDGTKKSLEDVAEGYLMDLIRRSLVVVGRKGLNGAIKTCRIHDLLRDLCLRKAEEENFPLDIYKYDKHSYSCPHSITSLTTSQLYLSSTDVLNIPSNCPCYSPEISQSFFLDVSIHWDTSKLIRDLNISSIELFVFPCEVLQLVQLRYLDLRFTAGNPPESISVLRELQTLIMSSSMNMVVPKNLWKMINMRHLCINSGENLLKFSSAEEPSLLRNMRTMSQVSPIMPCQHIFAKTPNLRKLGLCGPLTMNAELKCPDLGPLTLLESLKLVNTIPSCKAGRVSNSIIFPASLKNLALSDTCLDWKEDWVFQMMPNLEVLKLKCNAFFGNDWETSAEAFPRLKFLKLDELDIVTWTASRDHFPVLQHLQVYRCPYLMEIPEDFGNIYTLEWIEVSGCSDAATESARDIKREQERNGNDWLKILFSHLPSKPRRRPPGI
ncbi:putative late blight resistance protein homolog R1B-14 isoform X2 [Daucus carota subsp. sativus]|uniref:putative late blight resistance protein homolog R1B-14 isoform X2 n=1 Tax=Daucus carota subsp. sativus TaxID=79200 RepID=UPI0007EF95DD|nr:PREDICTED: putative late blight resistance protein homolog R1B-14 isoform X2 [Daucus carota subsp. sativus]